jgi:Early transcription elongation factor of RNA pol II, NGN section
VPYPACCGLPTRYAAIYLSDKVRCQHHAPGPEGLSRILHAVRAVRRASCDGQRCVRASCSGRHACCACCAQGLLPTDSDPKLWMVQTRPGHEREFVICLLQKCHELAARGTPLSIKSAFCHDHLQVLAAG